MALDARVGRDRILVHTMDDLSADPSGVLRLTCRFLGLDPSGAEGVELRSRNTFGDRTINSADGQSKLRLQRRSPEVSGDSYPAIDAQLEADLRRQFCDENLALAEWLGRDLSAWLPN